MGGTVITDLDFFYGATGGVTDCDSITDWAPEPVLDNEIYVQGTGALSMKVAKETLTCMFTLASPQDITGKTLYIWAYTLLIRILATQANGGFGLRVEDGAGNWGEWYLAGSDTWTGAWKAFAVHTDTAFSNQSATPPDRTAITKIGVTWTTTALPKVYPNCFWDALRIGTYLGIKGGSETDPADFDAMLAAEDLVANKWGILAREGGIIFCQGDLRFGSTVAGEATYFKDTSEVIVFRERILEVITYEVLIQGNATATTKVYFGEEVGGRGVAGCMFRSEGASKFDFTATDPNITDLGVYGCYFYDANTVSLPAYSDTRKVLSTSFEGCAPVLIDTCTVKFCSFISADDAGAEISSTDFNMTDSDFINCPYGVRITITGTFTFDALMFTGNTVDIDNTSGGAITVNCVNGSNPVTYTGDTTIVNVVYVTVDVIDKELDPIEGAQVWVYNLTDGVEIMNKATDVNGRAQTTVSYVGDKDLEVRVRKSTPPEVRYLPVKTYGTLTSAGFYTTVTLYEDLIVA